MEKQRFAVLLRPTERAALRELAQQVDRSEGATVRLLIRAEAERRGMWPAVNEAAPRGQGSERAAIPG